ncbi:MAG: hypothetical protein PHU85_00015 [Phycisphaerae bacterium]|nr:hypothetical protein [Phycisphaerae bacterium]
MANETQNSGGVIGDTGATGGLPANLTPIAVPDVDPGAATVSIPKVLTALMPLWVANVPDVWKQMGLAVAGCGGRLRTAHPNIAYLFNRIGEHMSAVLFHQCARLDRWPEMDVLKVMHDCYVNARDLLNSTLVADNKERPRATETGAQSIPFRAWVMPFYGSYVRNEQIVLWARRNLELMTSLMLSPENSFTYGFSQQFVDRVAVPLRENYKWMLINLMKVDPAKVTDAYVATQADFDAYAAAKNSVDRNLVQNQGSLDPLWTPSANDRTWCAGAYTYLQIAPLLRVWSETAAPAVPDEATGAGSSAATASGGISTSA